MGLRPFDFLVFSKESVMSAKFSEKMPPQVTLPETNSSPPKMDGWNTILSFWGPAYFQGRFAVSFREGSSFS